MDMLIKEDMSLTGTLRVRNCHRRREQLATDGFILIDLVLVLEFELDMDI